MSFCTSIKNNKIQETLIQYYETKNVNSIDTYALNYSNERLLCTYR
jgi:hypothetical protein